MAAFRKEFPLRTRAEKNGTIILKEIAEKRVQICLQENSIVKLSGKLDFSF